MDKITLFKIILEDTFKLKFPVLVVRKSRIMWPGRISCWGMYEGEWVKNKLKHRIEYNYKTTDEIIFATLAHEYVHAYQMEKDEELEHDNSTFIFWEKYFWEYYGIRLQF